MHTIISNKIYIKDASQEIWFWVKDNLVLTNPTYETLKRLGKDDTIRYKHISPKLNLFVEKGFDLIVPFGCLKALWKMIQKGTYETKFNNHGIVMNRNENIVQPLYDYQEKVVQGMLNAKSGILIGGCGSGKSNAGIEIAHRIGQKTLWLTHTSDLLNQSLNRAKSLYPGLRCGTITDGKVNIGEDITFATVQTMSMLDADIYKDEFDVVITDECHHISGAPTLMKQFMNVIEKIPARYKFGLTASETRNDSLTKCMYAATSVNENGEFKPIEKIARQDIKVMEAKHIKVDLDTPMSITNEYGDIEYPFLAEDGTFEFSKLIDYLSTNKERNNKIIEKIIENKERKQLVLCSRKEQCELINESLLQKGIRSVLLMGNVTKKKRKDIFDNVSSWDVAVATVSIAKEGLDVPELSVLHLCSPISNKSDTVQCAGRVERTMENKPEPIVFDYVDINLPYCVNRYKKRAGWLKRRY